jgi:nicotinamidase/pyrazinamidase
LFHLLLSFHFRIRRDGVGRRPKGRIEGEPIALCLPRCFAGVPGFTGVATVTQQGERRMGETRLGVDKDRSVLLLVDLQPDFMPGGALAVPDGDAILSPIRDLMERDPFGLYAATQDWHPPGHASFASVHRGRRPFDVVQLYGRPQTLWPDHCVQGTPGAALHPAIPWRRAAMILRKGMEPDVDSYSGFRNNWNRDGERPPTGLAGYLRERGIRSVFVCGLARDFCVKWSAQDAAASGFETRVLWDLSRPVDPGSDAAVRAELAKAGVGVLDSAALSAPLAG